MLKEEEHLDSLLPASYFAKHAAFRDALQKDIISPPKLDEEELLNAELGQGRLHELVDRLPSGLRESPRRPMRCTFNAYQAGISSSSNRWTSHLVCSHTQFYAKPIPLFLLEPAFWTRHLSCRDGCDCSDSPLKVVFASDALEENLLLPGQIEWADWKRFVAELNTKHTDGQIHERFIYGELCRSRLNTLLFIRSNFRESTYVPRWYRHGEFFRNNSAWLASATVYITIVLTAMQLGLATKALAENAFFHSASYGFTVFSIVAPLAAAGLIIVRYVCLTALHIISADRAYRNILRDGEKRFYSHGQHC
ncbi:hypothetical protein CKAH01_08797 [Colletotrichum kahawae]|uniref:Uncharacterized protein n=1 Tax=Colletotrichum kahawae TaxID=34407 RepID=A0AAD9Y065_COLKA|nr:hypothetical protein CKAH01_08797 [Colletotrichum kahawae]